MSKSLCLPSNFPMSMQLFRQRSMEATWDNTPLIDDIFVECFDVCVCFELV
eukprot:m.32432 g.32432  ORF g.32432 m.32432 type:complete len:51 (-) comp16642_c0_seq1:107-259(-)